MAKTRAQRKAERRAREQQGSPRAEEARAQHATQVPESGEVAEAKAVEATGASLEELEAPAPSRADTPQPAAAPKPSRRELSEEKRRQKSADAQKAKRQKERAKVVAAPPERRRGAVLGFFASCWAELKRVQWPNRETLIQASAVTVIFVAVAAAYLGAVDAAFSFLIKRIL
ncbi:MAG: SecE/Sec61-gamma subunit of protein translocation complex [Solirubrobacterales bacterium]|jgi:preprotein translocase SecE subunit|nr:SecE/Sec61-gamma subunit of protein translocation complex [Solirubrobacterales bacterium]MDX6652533.1 SecE/Sec61-gamma subunit of protein translocation complex [Solirubrobacterales bacterium]MDX6663259.1 SecE/Sec61-gamma subunit of protein translocation complex [Solirubrobacterales bacterium]